MLSGKALRAPDRVADSGFARLIVRGDLSFLVILASLGVALFWGAAHALSPGHGKTIVTAYLVGSRGTPRHAALLGLITTVTHTIGVFALGAVTLALSAFIVPDRLYPWINVLSGALVVIVGLAVLTGRWRSAHTHAHDHAHDHDHAHGHEDGHSHGGHHHHHHDEQPQDLRSLVAVGISGGLLPCPSALVVLLAAISLHRVAFGMLLDRRVQLRSRTHDHRDRTAGPLRQAGVRPLRPERRTDPVPAGGERTRDRRRRPRHDRARDSGAARLMFGLDTWLTHFSDGSTLIVVIAVAVILGLRHASDPDHLAAVTTLVSNGRGGATRLGLSWGLGHATSLVVLGIPIVLWKAYLPPNVEQSAEVTIGLVIMALALWLLVRWRRGAFAHAHDHTHLRVPPRRTPWQAFGIGLIHGIGGSGGVGVLLLATIHSHADGTARARAVRRVHRRLDGAPLDRIRDDALAPARPALVCTHRAGARSAQPRVRGLVHAGSADHRAVLVLSPPGRGRRPPRPNTILMSRFLAAAGLVAVFLGVLFAVLFTRPGVSAEPAARTAAPAKVKLSSTLPAWVAPGVRVGISGFAGAHQVVRVRLGGRSVAVVRSGRLGGFRLAVVAPQARPLRRLGALERRGRPRRDAARAPRDPRRGRRRDDR